MIAKSLVWQALDQLPPRRRAILILYELEGTQIPAIARPLGVTAVTVRWHLSVGRREMARALTASDIGRTNMKTLAELMREGDPLATRPRALRG